MSCFHPKVSTSDWGQTKRTPLKDTVEGRHELLPAQGKRYWIVRPAMNIA